MNNSKAQRKMFRPFSPAFFTEGTQVEVKTSGLRVAFTVDKLVKSTPDHYLIQSKEIDFDTGEVMAYSIGHVTKIYKRAPGVAKLDPTDNISYLEGIAERQLKTGQVCEALKHRSHYLTMSIDDLIIAVSDRYIKDDELVDPKKLVSMVMDTSIVKQHTTVGEWCANIYYTVSKKKLHSVVKRLVPKCRIKAKIAQKEYDAMIDEAMGPSDSIIDESHARIEGMYKVSTTPPKEPISLGQLLEQKFAKMEAEGKAFGSGYGTPLVTTTSVTHAILTDVARSITNEDVLNGALQDENHPVLATLRANVEKHIPRPGDIDLTQSDLPDHEANKHYVNGDDLLSNHITYVDDGETEEGNMTPPKAQDKEE